MSENKPKDKLYWLKKMGWGAFLFFFIKGLIWIAVFLGLGSWIKSVL